VTLPQNSPPPCVEPAPTVVTNILGPDGQLTPAEHQHCMNLELCICCGQTRYLARACPKQAYRTTGIVEAYVFLIDHSTDSSDRSKNDLVVISFLGEATA